jgi:hypothetical protein
LTIANICVKVVYGPVQTTSKTRVQKCREIQAQVWLPMLQEDQDSFVIQALVP